MRPPPIPRQLELAGRQTSPLIMPRNRDVALEREGDPGDDFPAQIALHHTVPDSRLRNFFNDVLFNQHLEHIRRALQALIRHIGNYRNVDLARYRRSRTVAIRAATMLECGRWIQDFGEPGNQPEGAQEMDEFGKFWCNMPGNLFAGPRAEARPYRRAVDDDPHDGFEAQAHLAMPVERHSRLRIMDDFMQRYCALTLPRRVGPPRGIPDPWQNPEAIHVAQRASHIYAEMACLHSYETVRPDAWDLFNPRGGEDGGRRENRYRLYRRQTG